MKALLPILGLILLCNSTAALAAESYPVFDQSYWQNEQSLATGKMRRGAGLGIAGLISIWPTSVMISKAAHNPQKYLALSAVFGMSSIGALLHGFGSIGFGKKQRDAATDFAAAYDDTPDAIDVAAERSEYEHSTRKSTQKVMVFGVFLSTQASILLANGIVQGVRKHRGADMGDIKIWPYYLAGGLMLPLGVAIIIKSKMNLDDLDTLPATDVATAPSIAPFFYRGDAGDSVYGVSLSSPF